MKRYFLPAFFLLLSASVFAQTVEDVLRYSQLRPSGTARYLGAGGAMGALGADFSSLSSNPAGLALFRSDELTVTPGLRFAHTDAALAGNESWEEDKSTFGFDNLGLVFNTTPRASRWKTFNVGIGFQRQNNFNQAVFYKGSAGGSIMNAFFLDDAKPVFDNNGTEQDLDPFGSGLAWAANAIYPQGDSISYDFAGFKNAAVERSHTLTTFGSMNELMLSFAGNYNEQLMVGVTVGVPFVNYRLEGEYVEEDPRNSTPDGNVPYFDKLTYTDFLRTEGIGINLKLGVIYKVNQFFRIGAAFHTPTALGLTDNYSNTFAYDYTVNNNSITGETLNSPDGTFDYKLRTPWRAVASAGVVVKRYGFISADVEWVDYGANRYNFTSNAPTNENENLERDLNADIQRKYQSAMNVRVGGELALDNFRLRAGVNLNGKPEEGETGFNTGFSFGAGVHTGSFFLDLGYRRYTGDSFVQEYNDAPKAATKNASSDIALTLGFKF